VAKSLKEKWALNRWNYTDGREHRRECDKKHKKKLKVNRTEVQLTAKWPKDSLLQMAQKYSWWSDALHLGMQHLNKRLAPSHYEWYAQWFIRFHITHHAKVLEPQHNHKL
jgi:hypothetical protein